MAQTAKQKAAAAAAAAKAAEKAALQKQLKAAQDLLAKQKANLAKLEKQQADIAAAREAAATEAENARVESETFLTDAGFVKDPKTNKWVVKPPEKPSISTDTRDAFEALKGLLNQYGLGSLGTTATRLMEMGLGDEEAFTKLKYDTSIDPSTGRPWNDAYSNRFAGNKSRIAKGLNAYDERTYMELENSYEETLRFYGLGNMISGNREENQKKWAGYMANDLSSTEFAGRIQAVSERVLNMDPLIKKQFQEYYPSLSNTDLVSYFLDPKETLPVLKNKITAAEIGSAAVGAGLSATGKGMAEELAGLGVTREGAQAGYEQIAGYLPRTQALGQIYDETGISYNQVTAEEEQFKGLASAKRKRETLRNLEEAAFAGSSGRLRTGQSQSNAGTF